MSLKSNKFTALAVDTESSSEDEAVTQQTSTVQRTQQRVRRAGVQPSTPKPKAAPAQEAPAPQAPRKKRRGKGIPLDLSKLPERPAWTAKAQPKPRPKAKGKTVNYRRLPDGSLVRVGDDGSVVAVTNNKSRPQQPVPQASDFPAIGSAGSWLYIGSWAQGVQGIRAAVSLADPEEVKARKAEARLAWLNKRRSEQNKVSVEDDEAEEANVCPAEDYDIYQDYPGYEPEQAEEIEEIEEIEELEDEELKEPGFSLSPAQPSDWVVVSHRKPATQDEVPDSWEDL